MYFYNDSTYEMRFLHFIFLTGVTILVAACIERPDPEGHLPPELGTPEVVADGFMVSVTCGITLHGEGSAVSCGFLFSDGSGKEERLTLQPVDGRLSYRWKGLQDHVGYAVCAFVSNGDREILSDKVTFQCGGGEIAVPIKDGYLKQWILERYDRNGDGQISSTEADAVTTIHLDSCSDVESLDGIEWFPNLVELWMTGAETGQGKLTQVDLSHNSKLRIVNLERNSLTSIDLTALTELREIYLNCNDIPRIDFSSNSLLTDIMLNENRLVELPNLGDSQTLTAYHLCGYGARLITDPAYFNRWPKLKAVNFCQYQSDTIDLSALTALEDVWAWDMPYLKELDFSNSPRLSRIEVPHCKNLETIYVHDDVDISQLVLLVEGSDKVVVKHKEEQ